MFFPEKGFLRDKCNARTITKTFYCPPLEKSDIGTSFRGNHT